MDSASKIFDILKERGMTAKELSDLTGISQGNITDWKKGRANPSATAINKIAKAFGVSVAFLLEGENDESGNDFVKMPIFKEKASAGGGEPLYGDGEAYLKSFSSNDIPRGATHGVYINGDSMEPLINDGDLIWIIKDAPVEDGQIGLFVLNGEGFCKKIKHDYDREAVFFLSANPTYPPRKIREGDTVKTVGRVLV